MKRRIFLSLATATPFVRAATGAGDLNGRWDITIPNSDRSRAWWVEIKGADTPKPTGSFVGAPGGNCDPIEDLSVQNGEARWSFSRPARNKSKAWKGVYRAHVEGGKLKGVLEIEGEKSVEWQGVRAPKFPRKDAGSLRRGEPVELFNGRDTAGWHVTARNAALAWKAEGGALKNSPGASDIATEARFGDFLLHAEFRVGEHSNSGIGLRGRYEVQILEDYGKPPNTHGNGALYSRILPTKNASKPAGEWQAFDITLVGNVVTVVVNGAKVIDSKEIDGLTAIATDPNEAEPGPITLQGDHGPVEFRKLTLTPLLGKA